MFKTILAGFENLLWNSRFMLVLAVVASIFAALALVLIGTYDVYSTLSGVFSVLGNSELSKDLDKKVIAQLIGAVDVYLIATVMLIFGVGLYELFIGKLSIMEADQKSSKVLLIENLDQLKEKLASVIIMVLIVTFFKQALSLKYADVYSLLALSLSILLVALSASLVIKSKLKGSKDAEPAD